MRMCLPAGNEKTQKMYLVSTFEKEKRIKRSAVSTAGKGNYQKTFFVST